jgi:acyl-CoA thioester hydrolase
MLVRETPGDNLATMPTHVHRLRVYWEDTDAGGVVFYANYLKFFERARTEWLRSLGISQRELAQREGVLFVVTDSRVSHKAPAHLDDTLDVTVDVERRGTASLTIAQQARRDGTVLAEGTVRIGCVDASSFRPQRLPAAIAAALG